MDRVGQKWDGFAFALLKILLFCLRELLQSYVTNLIWRIEVPVDQTVTKLKPNNREIFCLCSQTKARFPVLKSATFIPTACFGFLRFEAMFFH